MKDIKHDQDELFDAAIRVSVFLTQMKLRVVFAESCTAGLIAATLSRISGISAHLCGSFVTYRNDSKHQWLGVSSEDLSSPNIGPVSETVARQMAFGALAQTPEADIAVSITGHLGPNAPEDLDGVAYSAIQFRKDIQKDTKSSLVACLQLDELTSAEEKLQISLREHRQHIAAYIVLQNLAAKLETVIAQQR